MLTYECTLTHTAEDGTVTTVPYKGNLGFWLSSQRQYKKNNEAADLLEGTSSATKVKKQTTKLTESRLSLLQVLVDEKKLLWDASSLKPSGQGRDNIDSSWQLCFAALKVFIHKHGHCEVPVKEVYEYIIPGAGEGGTDALFNGMLGDWVQKQRQLHKGKLGKKDAASQLPPDQEAAIQQLVDQGECYFTNHFI